MNIVHYNNVMKLQCMKEMWDYGAIALVLDSTEVFLQVTWLVLGAWKKYNKHKGRGTCLPSHVSLMFPLKLTVSSTWECCILLWAMSPMSLASSLRKGKSRLMGWWWSSWARCSVSHRDGRLVMLCLPCLPLACHPHHANSLLSGRRACSLVLGVFLKMNLRRRTLWFRFGSRQ